MQVAPSRSSSSRDQAAAPPRPPPWFRLRPWLIGLAILALAIAGLLAFAAWGAPGLIRSEALKALERTYHRPARLGAVHINPLALRLELDGFGLPDRDGKPMVGFRKLVAAISPSSIWRGKLDLAEITLDQPSVRAVRRADGRINLADLAPPPSAHEKARPFSLRIERFRLDGGEATLVDQQRPDPIERRLSRIAFSLADFSTTADGAIYRLSARSDQDEGVEWQGTLGVAPVASVGRFRFSGWKAPRIAALLGPALPARVTAGRIDVDGAYRFSLAGRKPSLSVDVAEADLKDAALRAPGEKQDWVKLSALQISDAHLDLDRADLRLGHILATGPDVTAWLDKRDGVNLARFAPKPSAAPAAPPSPSTGPAWTVEAPDIRVVQGRVAFEDRSAREPMALSAAPIQIAVADFAYPLTGPIRISADAALDDGSTITAKGALSLPTKAGQGPTGVIDVVADSVGLARFQPYVRKTANLRIATGELSAKGRITLKDKGVVAYRGQAEIDDLEAVDPVLKSDLVTWDRLALNDIAAVSNPLEVNIRQIVASGAYARVVLEQNYVLNIRTALEASDETSPTPAKTAPIPSGAVSIDLQAASKPPSEASPPSQTPPAAPPKPVPVEVGQVLVKDGRMDFTDLTVLPHFSAGIQALNGTIAGLSGRPGSKAAVDLKGGVDRYAPVIISGALDPFDTTRFTDIRMNFQNMELTTFSPYSGKFAGYRIDKGKLSIDLHYLIADRKLDATHHVVVDQLQLGDKVDSAEAVKLPIKLIVALLKDKNGVIDLPIDISGSLDDPKFRIWPVIWKVVGNLFGKIAASPFTLLSKLVGGGGEEMGHIQFEPGQAVIAETERQKLLGLAKALTERPALSLEIPLTEAPDLDRPALSEVRYRDALAAAARTTFKGQGAPGLDAVLAAPKLKRRLLEAVYRQTIGQKPLPPKTPPPAAGAKPDPDQVADDWLEAQLRPRFDAGDQAVQRLAQARAEAVEAVLMGGGSITPQRLFVVTAQPLDKGPIDMALALR